jgi:hypothetical protein
MILTGGNRKTLGRTCPNATLSTKNSTWTDPEVNPVLRGERPATNRLSHSTTCVPDLQTLAFELSKQEMSGYGYNRIYSIEPLRKQYVLVCVRHIYWDCMNALRRGELCYYAPAALLWIVKGRLVI